MTQRFILKDVVTNLYWYGSYESKYWTDDILESYMFDDRREMEDLISWHREFEYMVLQVIEIWK
jgi:hypothetical protein